MPKEMFLENLNNFFAKYPQLMVRKILCVFIITMISIRKDATFMPECIKAVVVVKSLLVRAIQRDDCEVGVEFDNTFLNLTQFVIGLSYFTDREVVAIKNYCNAAIPDQGRTLELYLNEKIVGASSKKIRHSKAMLMTYARMEAIVGAHVERFTLDLNCKLSDEEIASNIVEYYKEQGYNVTVCKKFIIRAEKDAEAKRIFFTNYDKYVMLTVDEA